MYLVYINKIGQNWKGNYVYEFLFSDILEDIQQDKMETMMSFTMTFALRHPDFWMLLGMSITKKKKN